MEWKYLKAATSSGTLLRSNVQNLFLTFIAKSAFGKCSMAAVTPRTHLGQNSEICPENFRTIQIVKIFRWLRPFQDYHCSQ
jgi:hypothetical protein